MDDTLTLSEMIEHADDVAERTKLSNPSCSVRHECLAAALRELEQYQNQNHKTKVMEAETKDE